MRGKPNYDEIPKAKSGITPAHAGKTLILPMRSCAEKDHPRACGENFAFAVKVVGVSGSPPRMRGKRRDSPHSHLSLEDHPRACGENHGALFFADKVCGSPPRMRGKLDTPAEETETDRITPAHAGKTTCWHLRR